MVDINIVINQQRMQLSQIRNCRNVHVKNEDMILNIMIQILDNYKEEKYVNTRTFFHLLFMKYLRFSYDLLKIYSYAFQMIKMVYTL